MSLRGKLVFVLMVAAFLPMVVVLGVPMLRAGKRVREETDRRLALARHQATLLVERHRKETAGRVEQAAWDLGHDNSAHATVLGGPEEAARRIARSLAERHGLDELAILGATGALLAASRADTGAELRGALADLPESSVELRPLPPDPTARKGRVAFFARRVLPLPSESLSLVGGRALGCELIAGIAEISGEPAALLDGSGMEVESAGEPVDAGDRVMEEIPLGDRGWVIRISVPAGDVRRERWELVGAFAGIAPFALASALVVGMLLAEGISRPIRALVARAEEISTRRAGFSLLAPERDEVRRLILAFDRMLDALSESERERLRAERIAAWQEVARRIAHEVRNPLSPIKLAVENLRRTREKAPADLDRALEEETATILEEVESLRRLVDEFSLFARLPKPQLAPCDPRHVVLQALSLFAPRIEEAGVRVTVSTQEAPSQIVADAEQIGRALKNVLANALEALEPVADRRLAIAVRPAHGEPRRCAEIEVRDSGIGFEPEVLKRVFEPYFTTRGERGGTGLGMAIAYRIVTEHGGAIEAAGAPGKGATITIRLPVAGPPSPSA